MCRHTTASCNALKRCSRMPSRANLYVQNMLHAGSTTGSTAGSSTGSTTGSTSACASRTAKGGRELGRAPEKLHGTLLTPCVCLSQVCCLMHRGPLLKRTLSRLSLSHTLSLPLSLCYSFRTPLCWCMLMHRQSPLPDLRQSTQHTTRHTHKLTVQHSVAHQHETQDTISTPVPGDQLRRQHKRSDTCMRQTQALQTDAQHLLLCIYYGNNVSLHRCYHAATVANTLICSFTAATMASLLSLTYRTRLA